MSEKEVDRREEIYNKFVQTPNVDNIFMAMDENGKRMCLELLEYMANKGVVCCMDSDGPYFRVRGEVLTTEQLFKNFL